MAIHGTEDQVLPYQEELEMWEQANSRCETDFPDSYVRASREAVAGIKTDCDVPGMLELQEDVE